MEAMNSSAMVERPRPLAVVLSTIVTIGYFIFVLLVAVGKPLLASMLWPGVSLGILLTALLIVLCIVFSVAFTVLINDDRQHP